MKTIIRWSGAAAALLFVLSAAEGRAHCDTLEGPVVTSARAALKQGDVTPVLRWVRAEDEPAIREAFRRTQSVRRQSQEAAELADTWFFETLVRVHRAGEGAPYTGLKAGAPEEPAVVAVDTAIASGKDDGVLAQTARPLHAALTAKFERLQALRAHAEHSVEAGRDYVAAYVDYVHFVERLATVAAHSGSRDKAEHAH